MRVFGTLGLDFSLLIRPDSACFWLAEKSRSALWSAQCAFHASHTHGACQQPYREGALTHAALQEKRPKACFWFTHQAGACLVQLSEELAQTNCLLPNF